jgi:hypothetical protein
LRAGALGVKSRRLSASSERSWKAARGHSRAPHDSLRGAWGRERRSAAAGTTAEPTEGGAIFSRDGLFSAACATIFRRLAARRGPRSPADAGPLRG